MTKGRLQHVTDTYRQQLQAREAQAEAQLEAAYQRTLASIQPQIDRLMKQIATMQAAGQEIPLSFLYQQNRLVGIQHVIEQQINHFGSTAQMTTEQLKKDAVTLAQEASQAQMYAALPSGFSAMFNVPNIRAIETIVGSTQAGSPLADLFNGFGTEASQGAKDALITGITLGQAPKTVAKGIQDALGVSRSRALTISRTEMMRAYNGAALENYRANSNVINAWEWLATGARSCAMCIDMDGTIHDLDEEFASHPCCRCTPIPVTDTSTPRGLTGSDWFDAQSSDVQQEILSPSKYAAYQDGAITLDDLVGVKQSATWGMSRYEKSLKEVLGVDEAQQYY